MIFFLSLSIFPGCSGSNPASTPVDGNIINGITGNFDSMPVGVADRFSDGSPASGMGAMGLFNLYVDSVNGTAELTSLRQTALTDVLEVVDITNFLQMAPCYDCARIGSVSLDADSNLVVSIGIKHPFPAGDPLKPISGKNRGDLHVFNIEGTIISNAAGKLFAYIGETAAGFTLVNADGYTGYLDDSLDEIYPTDATVHPYILHFDDYTAGNFDASNPMGFDSVTDPPPSGNLVMAMGCDYDYQDYVFDLSTGPMDFIYAVGCTYAVSSAYKSERFAPEYRIPQHNKKAASEVSVEIISNDLEAGDESSYALIRVNVVDINHGVAVGGNLDEMLADSSVSAITIDAPDIETNILNVDVSSPSGTGHDPSDPLAFGAIMMNTANASEGTYNCLVKVTDSYAPGQNESLLLNGMDGISRVEPTENPLTGLFDISEFATYQIFTINVSEPSTIIYVDSSHPGPLYEGTMANPFLTIQEGVDAAADGFMVRVDDSGTPYEEEVLMKSGVTVLSYNWDDTDGSARAFIDSPDDDDTHSVVFDTVDNAILSGFQIGFAGGCSEYPFDVTEMIRVDDGTGNIIRDCLFTGNTNMVMVIPIKAVGSQYLTIEHCRIAEMDKDTANSGCTDFYGIDADNCPGLVIQNNIFANIRPTEDENSKNFWMCDITISNSVTLKNNLINHIIPHAGVGFMGAMLLEGFSFEDCSDIEIINNTVDNMDCRDAFFIQQAYAYHFHNCTNVAFSNNIASNIFSIGWPPPLARGIWARDCTVICDYTNTFNIGPGVQGADYHGGASAGTGAITSNPDYNDPGNEDYDLLPTSPAQNGDPSIDDWDGNPGDGSRMGCHGGPGGETVGLLT